MPSASQSGFHLRYSTSVHYLNVLTQYNITDKEHVWRRMLLNAEQTVGVVRCSNLCTSSVHSEQLIIQFDVSLEAGRGHALSEE